MDEKELLSQEPELSLHWSTKHGGEMEIKHWAVKALAASMADTLKTFGAENYVTCEMTYPDTGPLVVTVQRKCGKSPGEVIGELEDLLSRVLREHFEHAPYTETAFEAHQYLAKHAALKARAQCLDEENAKRWSWWRRALMRLALARWR